MNTTATNAQPVWTLASLIDDFNVHGTHTVSNCGGYEVEISDDGETARVRTAFGSARPEVSDWLPIVDVSDDGDDSNDDANYVIDPEGLYIPLNSVMRV